MPRKSIRRLVGVYRLRQYSGSPRARPSAPVRRANLNQAGHARIAPDVLAILHALPDLTCAISDALDRIGCGSVLAAPALPLPNVGQRVCGPAITMRCAPYGGDQYAIRNRGADHFYGDRDLFGVAMP